MSTATHTAPPPVEAEGMPMVVPPHLAGIFERAHQQIQEAYGISPGVPTLVRIWLGCGSPSLVRRKFEMAVLGKSKACYEFDEEGDEDGDDI